MIHLDSDCLQSVHYRTLFWELMFWPEGNKHYIWMEGVMMANKPPRALTVFFPDLSFSRAVKNKAFACNACFLSVSIFTTDISDT